MTTVVLPCSARPLIAGSPVFFGATAWAVEAAEGSNRPPLIATAIATSQPPARRPGVQASVEVCAPTSGSDRGHCHPSLVASSLSRSYDASGGPDARNPFGLLRNTCGLLTRAPRSSRPGSWRACRYTPRPRWPSRSEKRPGRGATSAARSMESQHPGCRSARPAASRSSRTACARPARRIGAVKSSRSASRPPSAHSRDSPGP